MPTVRISDLGEDGCLAFDLADLLSLLGDAAAESRWVCTVEAIVSKPGVKYLDWALAGKHVYEGAVLFQLANNTLQVHDGRFEAFREGDDSPWVTLEAFDTTWWEVSSQDAKLVDSIRGKFKCVENRGATSSRDGG